MSASPQKVFTRSWADTPRRSRALWLSLALALSAVYGAMFLAQVWGEQRIQDDARQHVFWMQRFVERDAFPGDLIADYFQAVAPYGYSALYLGAAKLGWHPFVFSKVLPLLLALAATVYAFRLALLLYPSAFGAFAASALLNQGMWMRDNIASGTPRAFAIPLLAAFLYYFARRAIPGSLACLGLSGMFYPQTALIALGAAGLGIFRLRPPYFSMRRTDYFWLAGALLVALIVLVPFFFKSSGYGPVISAAQARAMPEFQEQGRSEFFVDDAKKFWASGKRSGFLPRLGNNNPLIWLFVALPFLWQRKLYAASKNAWHALGLMLAACAILWAAAHLVLFKLHLPTRYTEQSLSLGLALAAGVGMALIAERLVKTRLGLFLLAGILIILLIVPIARFAQGKFPNAKVVAGNAPALYRFFSSQPRDIAIASLSPHADFIPSFSRRSVLVAREYAIPYHLGYYEEFSERVRELIRAQYTPRIAEVKEFIGRYGIDYIVVDANAFTADYLKQNRWLMQYEEAAHALTGGHRPALVSLLDSCTALRSAGVIVLDAACIVHADAGAGS